MLVAPAPAQAGDGHPFLLLEWIPAYAGMTEWKETCLTMHFTGERIWDKKE